MSNHFRFVVTGYHYITDEKGDCQDILSYNILTIDNLTLPEALTELAKYATEHPECFTDDSKFVDDETGLLSSIGLSAKGGGWGAYILNMKEEN